MSQKLQYIMIDGIKCYSPDVANSYHDYPDGGFDVTDKLEAESFWVRSRNRLIKSIINKYSMRPNKTRFLDIGCGTGAVIQAVIGNSDLVITGSEIYLKGLFYAKNKLPDAEFVQFDVTQGILPEKFDMVGAFDVIEHIEDDIASISNVYEMLYDGGFFIVTVPQYMFLWSRLDEIVKHKRRYTRKELLIKLQRQGFVISYCSSFLFTLFPLMLVSRMIDFNKKEKESSEVEFENKVSFPKTLNWIFDKIMRFDETLISLGMSLPFGGSLLVVAKK
jgi:SAM-dependent methyltransferase